MRRARRDPHRQPQRPRTPPRDGRGCLGDRAHGHRPHDRRASDRCSPDGARGPAQRSGHGAHGTGETLAIDLRPGRASPWNSADHITILDTALAQLPDNERGQVLVRADTGASSKAFLWHITDAELEYSIGFAAHDTVRAAIEARVWL